MKKAERIEKFNEAKQEYYQIIKDLSDLTGSEKQIVWATDIRKEIVACFDKQLEGYFDVRRLTSSIVQLKIVNIMLVKERSAKFYIDNRYMLKKGIDIASEKYAFEFIKVPDDFDGDCIDYLTGFVREGMDIDEIERMLKIKRWGVK